MLLHLRSQPANARQLFLYQLFVRQFGTNNLPDAPTCVMSRVARRWGKQSRWGKEPSPSRTSTWPGNFRYRPKSGTNHPAHAERSAKGQADTAAGWYTITPLPEVGRRSSNIHRMFYDGSAREPPGGSVSSGRLNGDVALLKVNNEGGPGGGGKGATPDFGPCLHSDYTSGFEEFFSDATECKLG